MDNLPPNMGSGEERPEDAALRLSNALASQVLEGQKHLRRSLNMLQVAAWTLIAAAVAILVALLEHH